MSKNNGSDKKNKLDLMMLRLPKLQGEKIKVEKTEDYYNIFLAILKAENEKIRNNQQACRRLSRTL